MRRFLCLGFLLAAWGASGVFGQLKSGIDLKAVDKAVDPCQNFYRYACGGWIANNPIPPEYSRWGRFNVLADDNLKILREILDDSSAHPKRSAVDQKLGGLYSACMNEPAVDAAGYTPIKPALERIAALHDKKAVAAETASLHNESVNPFFRFSSSPDPDDAHATIADLDQSGLGMPDRSYYLEAKDEETRKKYLEFVTQMLALLGNSPADASTKAKNAIAIETALAKASLERTARRNPHLLLHKMSVTQLNALAPDFDFQQYFSRRGSPSFTGLNVSVPDFIKAVNDVIDSNSLDQVKDYLTWRLVDHYSGELSKPFVDLDFDFYSRYLNGTKQIQPRWKRCVQLTDRNLGDALGKKYVEKAFAGQSKQRTQEIVTMIEKEMAVDIDSLPWMGAETKQQALAKLKGVTNKIGYPDRWKDYSTVSISGDNLVASLRSTREFESHRDLNKIGKPVDRAEWGMTPPTVNAYYSPLQNNINFPAGILQPPFYASDADTAVNLGGIGAVIGHELTHGFDDQGRQFDADGNLRDWWTAKDNEEFKHRADCIADEYAGFVSVEDVHLNGRLTLGENGADNAGVHLAYMALMNAIESKLVKSDKMDGFTPQQRFFMGYAQIWCQNVRPESLRTSARTDPHSPGEFRVDGVLQNMSEFASAFGCTTGQPMVSAKACRVW